MRALTNVFMLVCLAASSCDNGGGEPASGQGGVVCYRLTLEHDDVRRGVRSVIHAERAEFDGLPGRGQGALDAVEITLASAGRDNRGLEVVTAQARSAIMRPDGSMRLEEATVVSGQGETLRLTADTVRIGAEGGFAAEGVRAKLRSP